MELPRYKASFDVLRSRTEPTTQDVLFIWELLMGFRDEYGFEDDRFRRYAIKQSDHGKKMAIKLLTAAEDENTKNELMTLYWRLLLFEAQSGVVDSYFLYLEKNRKPKRRFYMPRRDKFLQFGITQGMQDLIDDKIDLLTISMCPGSGKSTAGIFFLTGCMGWWPEMPNLASAHSGTLTRSFFDGVSQILCDTHEYTWHEIFPDVKFDKRSYMNSKDQTVNVGKPKRFKTLTCRAINASLTGATRCEKILYADDLCSGIEEALSKERMDKLWQTYNTDLKTRKKDDAKEIHIQTRWSVNDVVGRLQKEHEDDPRARFISIPALDAKGESNFNYDHRVGFSTKYFQDMRNSMDDVSWRCLYMNQPIEREGLLYHGDEIRRYLTLPHDPPEAILSIADTKNKGSDFFVQPVFLKYGEDYYMTDTICDDNSDYAVQYERSVQTVISNKVEVLRVESNNGGSRVAFEIAERLRKASYYCNITENYTTKNKETKIIVWAQWVKQHVLFKDKSLYLPRSDYGRFMGMLLSYTVAGKNAHDDAPDALAMFAEWAGRGADKPTQVFDSIF